MQEKTIIHFDGASRGNPGPASIGVVFEYETHKMTEHQRIPDTTNNQAEYQALHYALMNAETGGPLTIYGDSRLVIEQMKGNWKVKNPELKTWHDKCQMLAATYPEVEYHWLAREDNTEADAAANQALDQEGCELTVEYPEDNYNPVQELKDYMNKDAEKDFQDDPEKMYRMVQGLVEQIEHQD